MNRRRLYGKAVFDTVFGILGLVLLCLPLGVIALAVKATSPGPVFFLQERVGKDGRLFKIIKFRTMVPDAEKLGLKITVGHDPRVTPLGTVLRQYKLDELPQILNIVKGEMSFVGPRPEVPRYVALYTKEQRQVLTIRPGVTDLASIRFRNEAEMLGEAEDPEETYLKKILPQKLKINLEYVEKASLAYDIKLIAMTVKAVFFKS